MANYRKPPRMSSKEFEEFRESFNMFDKDQNGQITTQELANVMRNLGQNPSEHQVRQMIAELDTDKNGTVDFNEFLAMYGQQKTDSACDEAEVKAAFKTFDRNGDGYINSAELRHVMTCLGETLSEEEVDQMIQAADMDGNGKIDYHEFSKLLLKKK